MFARHRRGIFDLTMTALAIATLCTCTPAGELLLRAARHALGLTPRHRPLVAFFKAGPTGASPRWSLPEATAPVAEAAQSFGVSAAVLKGFALAASADPGSPELSVDLSAEGRLLLLDRGASEADLATPAGRVRAVGRAMPGLARTLGSDDAALCALVAGLEPVRYAVERARAAGRPPELEALLPHFPLLVRRQVATTVGTALALATAFELDWPVAGKPRVSSAFGARADPFTGARRNHTGVDLSIASGTKVLAASGGIVKRAGEDGVNGKFVVVDHGRGVTTAYCHNEELLVTRGARIARGQNIALSGSTGRSTGPHLHYQVELDGVPVDPQLLYAERERAMLQAAR